MKTLRGRLPELLLSALVPVALVACGDDSNGGSTKPDSGKEVATLADAGVCDQSRLGDSVFVTDEDLVYVCDGRNWTPESGGESSEGDGGKSSSETGSKNGGSSEDAFSSDASSSDSGEEGTVCENAAYDTTTYFCDTRDGSLYTKVRIGDRSGWPKT